MDVRARVLRILDDRATLACEEPTGCAACGPGRGCGLRWASRSGPRELDVQSARDCATPLACGDAVTVSVADGDLLRAAAWLYLPPLAGLLAGTLLVRYATASGDGMAALAGLSGLLAGWLMARARVRPPAILVSRADAPGPSA